jgi:hypothetical protein
MSVSGHHSNAGDASVAGGAYLINNKNQKTFQSNDEEMKPAVKNMQMDPYAGKMLPKISSNVSGSAVNLEQGLKPKAIQQNVNDLQQQQYQLLLQQQQAQLYAQNQQYQINQKSYQQQSKNGATLPVIGGIGGSSALPQINGGMLPQLSKLPTTNDINSGRSSKFQLPSASTVASNVQNTQRRRRKPRIGYTQAQVV